MEDMGPYVAEFSLIGSITTFSYGSSVLLGTSIPHFVTVTILSCTFASFYLLVRRLPGINRSFKFLYWKYFVISILMLEHEYGVDENDKKSFVLMGLASILSYVMIVFRHGWSFERRRGLPGLMQPVRIVTSRMMIFLLGIGVIGMFFFSRNYRWELVLVITLLVCVLTGIVLLIFQNFLRLLCLFSVLSYLSFLWFGFEMDSEQREQQLDLPLTIPIPLDILCFFLCYYIVVSTGMEPHVAEKVLEMMYWGFTMFSVSTIFFIYYYFHN